MLWVQIPPEQLFSFSMETSCSGLLYCLVLIYVHVGLRVFMLHVLYVEYSCMTTVDELIYSLYISTDARKPSSSLFSLLKYIILLIMHIHSWGSHSWTPPKRGHLYTAQLHSSGHWHTDGWYKRVYLNFAPPPKRKVPTTVWYGLL